MAEPYPNGVTAIRGRSRNCDSGAEPKLRFGGGAETAIQGRSRNCDSGADAETAIRGRRRQIEVSGAGAETAIRGRRRQIELSGAGAETAIQGRLIPLTPLSHPIELHTVPAL